MKLQISKAIVFAFAVAIANAASAETMQVRLTGHVPNRAIARAVHLGKAEANQFLSLAVPLKLRNQAELENLIQRLYTPGDALYGKYLTPAQFTERFAPTQAQYDSVVQYLRSKGFMQITTSSNRLLINTVAKVSDVERALGVQMHHYLTITGKNVVASTVEPAVDANVAGLIYGIVGLNNFATPHQHIAMFKRDGAGQGNPAGSGPNGGLMGTDVKTAYSLNGISQTGEGQVIGVAEFDGYTASDISTYAQQNGTSNPSIQNIYVDGYDGTPSQGQNSGSIEVELDLEMQAALAPAAKIISYEAAPPTTQSSFETEEIDVYTKIANDNLAKSISTSWGAPESSVQQATMQAENTAFMQMAAQGQTIYAASGDSGALDDGQNLGTDDPASQPYVVAAGGTHLNVDANMNYASESSWGSQADGSGGGGGISSVWTIPSWQQGLSNSNNKGSTSMRMVPDISMDADPASGYSIYFQGQWGVVGGTSCVSPLMAAFTGLVNQARAANGLGTVGNPNQVFSALGAGSNYSQVFHDVNDGSTNLYYPAVQGYDLSTGWGSLIGTGLFAALSSAGASN